MYHAAKRTRTIYAATKDRYQPRSTVASSHYPVGYVSCKRKRNLWLPLKWQKETKPASTDNHLATSRNSDSRPKKIVAKIYYIPISSIREQMEGTTGHRQHNNTSTTTLFSICTGINTNSLRICQIPPDLVSSSPFRFNQVTTDVVVWNAFRAKKWLIIASDGSLTDTAGTFRWKLTTNKHIDLFEGSDPVDGPIELGSSTRSEIGGFTAPLLLVTVLARFWGLKHSCSF